MEVFLLLETFLSENRYLLKEIPINTWLFYTLSFEKGVEGDFLLFEFNSLCMLVNFLKNSAT